MIIILMIINNKNISINMMIREFEEAKEMLRAALEQSKHEQSFVVLGKVIVDIIVIIIGVIVITVIMVIIVIVKIVIIVIIVIIIVIIVILDIIFVIIYVHI